LESAFDVSSVAVSVSISDDDDRTRLLSLHHQIPMERHPSLRLIFVCHLPVLSHVQKDEEDEDEDEGDGGDGGADDDG